MIGFSSALPIQVTSGMELRNMDVRLQKTELFRIRGKVVTPGGEPTSDVQLTIAPADIYDLGASMRKYFRPSGSAIELGAFELRNLPPGDYIIRSEPKSLSSPLLLVSETVTVRRHDVDDLVLRLRPGAEIAGRITLDGAPLTPQQSAASRRLVSLETLAGVPGKSARMGTDGAFSVRDISPDVYHVGVSPPPGAYVKSVLFNGQDITQTSLDLTVATSGRLEISLASNPADVTGVVLGSDGSPLPRVSVTLWSPGGSDFGQNATTDAKGGFRFSNLAPGNYRIAAWERIEPGLAAFAEFREAFDESAVAVKLGENSHETVVAPLIGRATIDTEVARLP